MQFYVSTMVIYDVLFVSHRKDTDEQQNQITMNEYKQKGRRDREIKKNIVLSKVIKSRGKLSNSVNTNGR